MRLSLVNFKGLEKVHGAPLGAEDIAQVKEKFGFDPSVSFHVPQDVYDAYSQVAKNGALIEESWNRMFESYNKNFPTEVFNPHFQDNTQFIESHLKSREELKVNYHLKLFRLLSQDTHQLILLWLRGRLLIIPQILYRPKKIVGNCIEQDC